MRDRLRRLRYRFSWKVRRVRARIRIFTVGVRNLDLRFAFMPPIMGADDGDGSGGGDGGGDGSGAGGGDGGGDGGGGKPADPPKPKKDPPEANKVAEAKRLQKKAEKEAEEARAKAEELEGKDQSELEKAQRERDKAKKEADDAKAEAKKIKHGAYVRSAAAKLNAVDAEAVEALVDLDAAEDPETAEQLVKELAEAKPALFGQRPKPGEGNPQPGSFGTPAAGGGDGGQGGGVPGIGADGKVDEGAVRGNIGKGILGLVKGRAESGGEGEGDEGDE